MKRPAWRHMDWGTALAFALPLALYLRTLAPTIYNLDSAELTTAAATLGLTRSTGYPLYILLGHLFSKIPLGDVGWRLNLFSAFCGALTIALSWRLLKGWGLGPWAAAGALGLLACAPFFWSLSTTAEVYTLHTALSAGLLLALQGWRRRPGAARLALVGLCAGLCLCNHLASLLLLPGCAWLIVDGLPRRGWPRVLAAGLAGLLLGLTPYLYLPLRLGANPAFNYAGLYDASGVFHPLNLASWPGFWQLVLGRQFSGLMFHYQAESALPALRLMLGSLWRAFLVIGVGPGLLGAAALWRRSHAWAAATMLMFAANALFYVGYQALDVETMFLPLLWLFALWLAAGWQLILDWLARLQGLRWSRAALRALLLGTLLAGLAFTWRSADHSQDWSARTLGESTLQRLEPGALYFGWWDTAPVMTYLQLVEGARPDVQVINRFLILPDDLAAWARAQAAARPVYADGPFAPAAGFESRQVREKLFRLVVLQ